MASELLEWGRAEIRIEPLAVNRDGLKLLEIGASGYVVILVAFIAFQPAEFDSLGAALEKIRVVGSVFGRDQHDMHVRPVGRFEVRQSKDQMPIGLPVNRGAAGCIVDFSMGSCRSPEVALSPARSRTGSPLPI